MTGAKFQVSLCDGEQRFKLVFFTLFIRHEGHEVVFFFVVNENKQFFHFVKNTLVTSLLITFK